MVMGCGPQRVRGRGDTRDGTMCGGCGRGTRRDERKAAARVDRDATRVIEPAAGERGGRPGGDVDTANAMVTVLRCIMEEHTE